MSIENIEWLNEAFFANVVKSHLNLNQDEYEFISIDKSPAMKPGDGYMSEIIRSRIKIKGNDGVEQSLSYIVKINIPSELYEEMVNKCRFFPKEQKMFSVFIPEFEKLYVNAGVNITLGPKLYYTTDTPTAVIVMEDLGHHKMMDKKLGLDEQHCKMGFSWMAKFHAASMVYKEINEPYPEDFYSGGFTMKMEKSSQDFLNNFMDPYIAALRKLPEGEKYVEKVEKWREVLFAAICKTVEFDESSFNVLNHGDMWINNFLFKYDEDQKLVDLKLVDYQMCHWGTVAHDIYYYMMSPCSKEIRVKKFDELIRFYFDKLIENLKLLNYSKRFPTFEELLQELSKRKFLGTSREILCKS